MGIATASGIALAICALAFVSCGRKDPPPDKQASSVRPTDDRASPPTSPEPMSQTAGPADSGSTAIEQSTSPAASGGESVATQSDQSEGVPSFEPLADAHVGEWVRLAAMGSRELRYEVVRVGAATVTTQVTVLQDGKPLGLPAVREDMRNWDPPASSAKGNKASRSVSKATLETAGRSWDALLYEDRWTDEGVSYVRRTWVHPDAPVFGTLRMELFGDNVLESHLELTAFGRRGGPMGADKAQ